MESDLFSINNFDKINLFSFFYLVDPKHPCLPSLFWPELHLHIDRLGRLQLFLSPQAVGWTNSAVIGGVCWLHLGQPAGGEGHTGTKLGGGSSRLRGTQIRQRENTTFSQN